MAVSTAVVILLGLLADYLFRKIRLPGLVLVGIFCGPYVLHIMQPELLKVSVDLGLTALIVILLPAGLELGRDTLNRIGRPWPCCRSCSPRRSALLAFR